MMCAFMTPVLKNDWEIYNTKRSRNNSESSATRSPASGNNQHHHQHSHHHRSRPQQVMKRGIGETGRSFSYHAPSHGRTDMMYVGSPPRSYHMSTRNSRYSSSVGIHSAGTMSPPKSPLATVDNSHHGPVKSPSSGSLTKFHNKVMDKLKNVLHLKDDGHKEEEAKEDSRGQS